MIEQRKTTGRTGKMEAEKNAAEDAMPLFGELKTIDAIRTAPIETLEKIIGHAKAEVVYNYFRQGKLDL